MQENDYFSTFSKEDYQALADFRYALRCYLRFSEHVARSAGLTMQQHQALLFILGYPEREQVTIGELAERLQTRHHSTVGLVNRLEEQGLVMRTANKKDRREVFIKLTEKGLAVLNSLANVHQQELRRLRPQLSSLLEQISKLAGSH